MTDQELKQYCGAVTVPDREIMDAARRRQAELAKPPGSLGKLEDYSIRLAGITGQVRPHIEKCRVLVLAADNGVTAEGISSAPTSVTLSQVINMTRHKTGMSALAHYFGNEVVVADMGIDTDRPIPGVLDRKVRRSTANIAREPAMTRQQALQALETGMELAAQAAADGVQALGIGEMGIGNTTTSAAVLAALTHAPAQAVTGRGGGLTDAAFEKKKQVIDRALDAGYKPVSLLMERKQITGPAAGILSRCGDAPVYTADREMLAELTGFELTRGVLCAFRRPAPRPVEELCKNARRVAVLEGIVDSTNVGAIFRSAAALNMDAVLINPSCCDPLCRRAVRVSMGTVFQVPWGQLGETPADWPEKGMDILHSLGFKTAAMALSDRSVSIDDEQLAKEPKLAIVLGTEGDGLAADTIASCDYTVKIPMSHGVDSLNVAAASAVAFWQLGRQ